MARTLVVTNDFPPRRGGIETFVLTMASGLPPQDVVVYTAAMDRDSATDAGLPFPVIRDRAGTLLPTPRVARRVAEVLRAEQCEAVLYGASAPLGLLASGLAGAGARRQVAITHGHEVWWARLPGSRQALRRIGETTDVMTYLGEFTRQAIATALTPAARARMVQLVPGVDPAVFHPGSGGPEVRRRLGLGTERPVVACIARMVARKGQDALIRAWPLVLQQVPDAVLLLVGDGPDRSRLQQLARQHDGGDSIVMPGAVPWAELPPWFDAADVFAMPCRTRRLGLEPEALGIVFLEASATGKPIVVGNSGGAPDTCIDGETGYVVDGQDLRDIAGRLVSLLRDPSAAKAMGEQGRQWVTRQWTTAASVQRLRGLLDPGTELSAGG